MDHGDGQMCAYTLYIVQVTVLYGMAQKGRSSTSDLGHNQFDNTVHSSDPLDYSLIGADRECSLSCCFLQ